MALRNAQVFISYKRQNGQTPKLVSQIATKLEKYGYQVFLDTARLIGGTLWRQEIFEQIHKSDVLILLLESNTADSQWIQREVDMARGALVEILPVPIVDPENPAKIDLDDAAKKLAIDDLQRFFGHFDNSDENYERLVENIEYLKTRTRMNQRAWHNELRERWHVRPPREHNASFMAFGMEQCGCKIHLATGDIFEMGKTFDVIVNSENDHLQMARYFEFSTLSSALRRKGAYQGEKFLGDQVQDELNSYFGEVGRPAPWLGVFPTHAGHPKSDLHRYARYIFHAVTVRITRDVKKPILPIESEDDIIDVMRNCFQHVAIVNKEQGIHLPLKKKYAPEENYMPIKSIVFPIFGTGHGGRSIGQVVPHMLEGIYRCLRHPEEGFTIENIYVCVYSESEIALVEGLMRSHFGAPLKPQ